MSALAVNDPTSVRTLVQDLVATSRTLSKQDARAVRILVRWIEDTLLRKIKNIIGACSDAPVMCMYSCDGWSATVRTSTSETIGPQVRVDHRGRVRHEFCLERAMIRQLRPSGRETLAVMVRRPVGMCLGRRTGNFFTAATAFVPTLADLGAQGMKLQLYLLDGLHQASFMRLMRGRFALRCSTAEAFNDESERILHWVCEWVLGTNCKSHTCSNAIVWSLRRYSSRALRDDCHIAIKSLSNTSEGLRGKITEFVRSRVVGIPRDTCASDVEAFWKFCLIREDLLAFFTAADPVWDGAFLVVSEDFLRRRNSTQVLETMLLYLLSWTDWSETRWCAVKCASRQMLRSVVCGVRHLVSLVKADPDASGCYINGFDRVTDEVLNYLCVAACSSHPAETVHSKLMKDDRFLRFGQDMRRDMESSLSQVCMYPNLIWQRLHALFADDRHGSWQTLRSECIRCALVAAGYLQMGAFSMLEEVPWLYTQGDIAGHVARIRTTPIAELPQDETTRKICIGLANGVLPAVFERALELLRQASMTTNINERAHGYGARLCEVHRGYGYELVAGRSTLNSSFPLFQDSVVLRHIKLLQQKCDRLDRRMPQRTSHSSMHFKQMADERCAEGFIDDQDAFQELQGTMRDAAERWDALTPMQKQPFVADRLDHIDRQKGAIAEQKASLLEKVAGLKAAAQAELEAQGIPNLLSAAEKFSDQELSELVVRLRSPCTDVGGSNDAMSSAPQEPAVHEMNELERLNADLAPQGPNDVAKPWWVRHLARNRDEWYGCAIFDQDAEGDAIYLFLFAFQTPHCAWFLECREKPCIIQVAAHEDEGHSDVPACYRQFDFLQPLVLLPDYRLPIPEDASIGVHRLTHFRGGLLCTFHDPVSFEEFVRYHPTTTSQAQHKAGPRLRPSGDAIDAILRENPWLSREDFADQDVTRPRPQKAASRRRRTEESGSDGEDADKGDSEPAAVDDEEADSDDSSGIVDVEEELAAIRQQIAMTLDDHPDLYFRVVTRGGAWTLNHTGNVADSNRGEARGDLVKQWCAKYQWPLSMTFAMSRYGREGSARLAQEFCRRGTWFVRMCLESADPDAWTYTPEDCQSCPEDVDFIDFVLTFEADHPVLRRSFDIRGLAPRCG